jgi:hypothetical protein
MRKAPAMRALLALAVLALAVPACANDRAARSASTNAANMAKAEAAAAAAVNGIAAGPVAAAVATPGAGGAAPGPQASVAVSAAELGVSAPNSHRTKPGLSPRVGYLRLQAPLTDIDPLARGAAARQRLQAPARARRAAACAHARGRRARQAVCNDGTSAGYYFRKGTDASLWLIYLEGGMWCGCAPSLGAPSCARGWLTPGRARAPARPRRCYSEQTCQARAVLTPWEMSGTKFAAQVTLGGTPLRRCPARTPLSSHAGPHRSPRTAACPVRALTRTRPLGRPWGAALRAGIFETSAKNPWANANVAYLPYCSSDAWVGDVGASNVRALPRAALRC